MTSHVGRLYALAAGLVVFFLAWAVVAARPWQAAARDSRLQVLAVRQTQLRHDAALVRQIVTLRAGRARQLAIAASPPPAVRIVNLPPLTITRTS